MTKNIIQGMIALLFVLVICTLSAAAVDDTVTRDLPATANADASITVNLTVDIATSATYYGIDEIVPSGWTVTSATDSGDYTSEAGHVKWVVTAGAADKVYSYTVTVPADASGTCTFGGTYSSEVTAETAILGDPSVTVESVVDTVTRDLPATANADASITVNLTVDIATSATYYGIDEIVPSGWTVTSATDSGDYTSEAGHVKWVVTAGAADKVYSYTVTVPADASGTCTFGGTYSSEVTAETAILGDPSVTVESVVDTVTRDLPATANADASITVNLTVDIATSATYYGIDEIVPSGWTVTSATDSGDYTSEAGHVKWVVTAGAADKVYSYTVTVPADASGTCTFGGTYSSEVTAETAILGDPSVTVESVVDTVTRDLPATANADASITVNLTVDIATSATYYGIDEIVPSGWTVTSATDSGDYTSEAGHVKWVVTAGAADKVYSYTVTVPADASGTCTFGGTYSSEVTAETAILGDTSVTISAEDITPPVITAVTNTTPTASAVTITWTTDEASNSVVKYGTAPGTYTESKSSATLVTSHSIELTGLNPETKYYFVVNSTDASDNPSQSTEHSFTTAVEAAEDTTDPLIQSVTLDPTSTIPGGSIAVTVVATDDSGILSVTANGTTGTVTLTLQDTNTWGGTITAPDADGAYVVTVIVTDASANANQASDTAAFTVAADVTVPTISSVTLSTSSVGPSGSVTVTVVATDVSGIASVTANGTTGTTTLTAQGSNEWQGTITVPSTAGTYTVTVVATDESPNANARTDTSKSFTVSTDSCPITLSTTGYTLIAMPLNDPGISTASDLANRIAGCAEVVKYDETTGAFVSYVPGNPLNDFAIVKGRGYFVNGATVSSVTFHGSIWT